MPCSSRKRAVETLIGMRCPSALTMKAALLTTAAPVCMVCRRAHSASHMLARNTSEQRRPMASSRATPVICSAPRLKEVMRHSGSTVNTPSEMLSRMESVATADGFASPGSWGGGVKLCPSVMVALPPVRAR